MDSPRVERIEGVVYDPTTDSGRKAVFTGDEYVYIEDELVEGQRVRVTIEVLDV